MERGGERTGRDGGRCGVGVVGGADVCRRETGSAPVRGTKGVCVVVVTGAGVGSRAGTVIVGAGQESSGRHLVCYLEWLGPPVFNLEKFKKNLKNVIIDLQEVKSQSNFGDVGLPSVCLRLSRCFLVISINSVFGVLTFTP